MIPAEDVAKSVRHAQRREITLERTIAAHPEVGEGRLNLCDHLRCSRFA
jgi:hypothetical protein